MRFRRPWPRSRTRKYDNPRGKGDCCGDTRLPKPLRLTAYDSAHERTLCFHLISSTAPLASATHLREPGSRERTVPCLNLASTSTNKWSRHYTAVGS